MDRSQSKDALASRAARVAKAVMEVFVMYLNFQSFNLKFERGVSDVEQQRTTH
jgi:hypothetical protein